MDEMKRHILPKGLFGTECTFKVGIDFVILCLLASLTFYVELFKLYSSKISTSLCILTEYLETNILDLRLPFNCANW